MAQRILRRKHFPGSPVRVTRSPPLHLRTVVRGAGTCGGTGVIAELLRTLSLLQIAKLTRPTLRLSIFSQWLRELVARSRRRADGRTVDQLFRLRLNQPRAMVSRVGVAPARALFLERAIQPQSQWADRSPRAAPLLIIDRAYPSRCAFFLCRSTFRIIRI